MLINNRFFKVFKTAARGLEAQRIALSTAAENIANASTTRTADGTPYALKRTQHEVEDRNYTLFRSLLYRMQSEVQVSDARHLPSPSLRHTLPERELGPMTEVIEVQKTRMEYDPTHPHANTEGMVEYPDINVVEEMTRMISANRIYEANLSAVQAAKEMIKRTIDL